MEISLYFDNLESSEAIKNYVETKIGKVKKYLDEPITAQVTLSIEKQNHIVKVNLNAHGYLVHVEEKDTNLYSAIDLVADTLERKLKKYYDKLKKTKNNRKKLGELSISAKEEVFSLPEETAEEETKKIIKVKNYEMKIMDVEEAAMQLDLLNRDFLVFVNSETNSVAVIYRRKDGNFGLIEAQSK